MWILKQVSYSHLKYSKNSNNVGGIFIYLFILNRYGIEDWRNGYWKCGFANTGINYILKIY